MVARLGGDEFGVIMDGCTEQLAAQQVEGLYAHLTEHGVAGSLGWAAISVLRGFPAALAEADEAMCAAKRQRRADRQGVAPAQRKAGDPGSAGRSVVTVAQVSAEG